MNLSFIPFLFLATEAVQDEFRATMLMSVMERLVDETFERIEKLTSLINEPGIERTILKESSFDNFMQQVLFVERNLDTRSVFERFPMAIKSDDPDFWLTYLRSLSLVVDSVHDVLGMLIAGLPSNTKTLKDELDQMESIFTDWERWNIEYHRVLYAERVAVFRPFGSDTIETGMLVNYLVSCHRYLREPLNELLSYMKQPSQGIEMRYIQSRPFLGESIRRANSLLALLMSESITSPVGRIRRLSEQLSGLIDDIVMMMPKSKREGSQKLLADSRILDLRSRRLKIVLAEFVKLNGF